MNKEKLYKISVKTPNRFLNIKRKLVRTPTNFISTEKELKTLKTKFQSDGITQYSIEEYKEIPKKVEILKVNEKEKIELPKTKVDITNKKETTLTKILNS